MNSSSIGDLALSLQLSRQNAALKTELNRLSRELSTGISDDLGAKLRGNFSPLAGLERGLSVAGSHLVGISERRLEASAMQSAVEKLRAFGQISGALLTVQETGDPALVRNAGHDALSRFEASLQTLNSQVGGRSIFSGIETDLPAVADAETIFTAIETAIAGSSTAADVANLVEDWFLPGGGYDLLGYTGGPAATANYELSDSEATPPSPTAQDRNIRRFLRGLALGALVGRGTFAADPTEQGRLARLAGERLVSSDSQLVELQASIGVTERQIERAETEVRAESQALEIARNELISVDPYETVVRFENAEAQLQTLYSVTARLSGLSLTNYL